jgi:predicted nucleic acid-binding protein
MIVVLDTNVVLQALNPRHDYASIMDEWYGGRFVWALSTDILMEYREVIVRQSGSSRWNDLDRLLNLSACSLRVLPVSAFQPSSSFIFNF